MLSRITAILTIFLAASVCAAQEQKTRLRADAPKGTFETDYGTTTLTRVEVRVRNAGTIKAEDVQIDVTTPIGNTHQARGPKTLEPNAEGVYTCSPYETVVNEKKIKVNAGCSNCYR